MKTQLPDPPKSGQRIFFAERQCSEEIKVLDKQIESLEKRRSKLWKKHFTLTAKRRREEKLKSQIQ